MPLQWENWSDTVRHLDLKAIYHPKTLEELKANVKEASDKGFKLRVVGAGHSWSNLGLPATGGAIIQLDQMKAVLSVDGNVVEVQGGISIEELNDELFKRGLALPNMGDATPQAIAGAVGTETHGSGAKLGTFSELVEGMTLVRADGQEQALADEDLKAGRLSLGQLGATYSIKLAVLPAYFLHQEERLVRFRDDLPHMDELLQNRHLEYWFYPFTEKAVRYIRNTVDSTEEKNLPTWFDSLGTAFSARYVDWKGRNAPESLPEFYKGVVTDKTFPTTERQGPSHKILVGKANSWRNAIQTYTMEYLFPYKNLEKAFDELEKSTEAARQKGVFLGAPTQIRFTKKSERSFLTHFLHENTVSFSISFFTKHHGAHTFLPDIERRLLELEGKPHWGKVYYVRPAKDPRFETIRKKLDPNGVFGFEQPLYTPDP